jgi:GDPmannose 4,6-dehydratase
MQRITIMKTALITGVTGQDGSYLAENLLKKQNYKHVIGLVRRRSADGVNRLEQIQTHPALTIMQGELEDAGLLARLFSVYRIDECYNLAAQSFVRYSFDNPVATAMTNYIGVINLLEAIRHHSPNTRYYQASTSEMFGGLTEEYLSENHSFHPRSPYGTSKLAAYWHAVNMREAYGLFTCNGILFNHESPRRGSEFVTQKIAAAAVRFRAWKNSGGMGEPPVLRLGNLEARRDWGHAQDYVEGMRLMLQEEEPGDYVLATGQAHSVRDFVELSFAHPEVGVKIRWKGEGLNEVGSDADGRVLVAIDPVHYRPSEVHVLLGDWKKARECLGWKPQFSFEDMVDQMIRAQVARREGHGPTA